MAELEEKILKSLNNEKDLEEILKDLPHLQKNILSNYLNPVFKDKDKTELLASYNNLSKITKSLGRLFNLKKNNYLSEADIEQADIENVILKGGVSYNRYVWRSEHGENTCEYCSSLDGKEYESYDQIPDQPHPNCKCYVEVKKVKKVEPQTDGNDTEQPTPIPTPAPTPTPTPAPITTPQAQKWILPVSKGHKITSGYGNRMHPIHHRIIFHDGIDINAYANTPVYAVADGTVNEAHWYNGYGNYIEIKHVDGVVSFYGHLNSFNVKKGDKIVQGQIIAKSGNTGAGTAAHLHFGVHKNGQSVNPLDYLPSF